MKKIYLTEQDIHRMVVESLQTLLCESAVNNNRKKAKHYVFNFLATNTDIADGLKQVLNQQNIPQQQDENGNIYYKANGGTFLPFNEYIFQNIITELNLGRFGGGANTTIDNAKYDLGLVRMYIQNGWVNHRQDTVEKLGKIIQLLKNSPHFFQNIEGFNLQDFSNNWTLDKTYDLCKDEFKKLVTTNKEMFKDVGTSNLRTDYKIIPIRNQEEASQYSNYTSWCVCDSQQAYDSYTGQFGIFYFCLQDGFEDVPKQQGNNCPLDEYGLSMIAVCVTVEGMIKNITCRWNHDYGAGDNVMSVEELSKYLGVDPYQLFSPRSMEELVQMGYYPYEMVEEDVSKGDFSRLRLSQEVDDCVVYEVHGMNKYIIVRDNSICGNTWFSWVYDFDDNGITQVELNDKYNWIDINKNNGQGGLVSSDMWFDYVYSFDNNGIAVVELNYKYNWFDKNKNNGQGGLVWDKPIEQCFDKVEKFDDNGITVVELNDKWFFFTLDGQLLDFDTKQPLSQEQVQKIFQQQQLVSEMVNRLVRNYLR